MKSFNKAVYRTIEAEGVWSNHPKDPGKKTKYGITESLLKEAQKRGLALGIKIEDLTREQARDIYYKMFWLALRLNEVPNDTISEEIFDTAVNMGTVMAVKIVQKAMNYLGEKLVVDGILGAMTLKRLNYWTDRDNRALFICLNGFQFMRYAEINNKTFSRGWTKRIQDYQNEG